MQYVSIDKQGMVALVIINRMEALNALNSDVLSELREAFIGLGDDPAVRAIVLTGNGKAFVAGADIAEMKDFTPHEALAYAQQGTEVFSIIENVPQPVIASINGFALGGGCELALACDFRIASERARFGQPEVGLGITPGFGGTQRLARAVGIGEAMQMILTGKPIDAAEALRIGLVNAIYPPEELLTASMDLAGAIAANAPLAVQAAKRAIRAGADAHLEKGVRVESRLFAECFDTQDQKDAMEAFLEKRQGSGFQGK